MGQVSVPAAVLRLVDANLNRAREGLRVVEDTARFVWDDPAGYRRLRSLRHELDRVARARYADLVAARNSQGDAGRAIREGGRSSLKDVVAANLRRAEEAVRVLEEYSKVFAAQAAPRFKKIRFQLYQEEKRLLRKP